MRLSFLLLSLFLSGLSFAQDLTCRAKTFIGEDLLDVKVSIKEGNFKVSKYFAGKVLEVKSLSLNGKFIKECLRLHDPKKKEKVFDCVSKIIPEARKKDDSVRSLNNMLVHLSLIRTSGIESSDFIDIPSEKDFDLDKVTSGNLQVFHFGGMYPNHGIYEYFDGDGNLLARFYYRILPSLCK